MEIPEDSFQRAVSDTPKHIPLTVKLRMPFATALECIPQGSWSSRGMADRCITHSRRKGTPESSELVYSHGLQLVALCRKTRHVCLEIEIIPPIYYTSFSPLSFCDIISPASLTS